MGKTVQHPSGKRQFLRWRYAVLATIAAFFGTSCLSMEVEVDLQSSHHMDLALTYRLHSALWDLGVFDQESPERAVPVSRRDVEETALRHPGVTVEHYNVTRQDNTVVVEVRYRAADARGLAGIWGAAGGEPLTLSRNPAGNSHLILPLTPEGAVPDDAQRQLLENVFRDQTMRVTVQLPAAATSATAGPLEVLRDRSAVSVAAPLDRVLTAPESLKLEVRW